MTKAAILIIIALIVIVGIYTEMQRGNNLAATAKRLGLEFKSGLHPIPAELKGRGFDLLQQGASEIGNRMIGPHSGRLVDVFDYSFDATAAGEGFKAHPAVDDQINIERRNQTVVSLQSRVSFPDFDISPANTHMRSVAQRFGFLPIIMQNNKAFSQSYTLLANESEPVRRLFNADLQAFFLDHPGLVVEARGDHLLCYRFGKRLKANEIAGFMQRVDELMQLLEAAPGAD